MHRCILPALLLCGALHAAVIRGVVVEHQTGHPLARALVTAMPVASTAGGPQAVRTNSNGVFEFPPLPAGTYLVTAVRRSFAPAQYGQKSWRGSGIPVVLEEAATTTLSIRMQRFGAVSGNVLDENDVGLPEHDVIAYKNTRPPQIAGRGRTDDRGVFRIWGLEPGSYLVRTVGKQYEEGGYLPTFARESSRIDEARPVEVMLDQTSDVSVRPFPGRLLNVTGRVMSYPQGQVTISLISDVGTETATSDERGAFQFNPLPPGPYELLAVGVDRRNSAMAAYQPVTLDRDPTELRVNLFALPELQITVEDTKGNAMSAASVQLLGRRKDLAGEGKSETLRVLQSRVLLQPGRWDLALAPMANYYVAGFSTTRGEQAEGGRADGWNEILVSSPGVGVKFVLAPNPGTLRGKVTGESQAAVAGVPVFLEPFDLERRRRLGEVRTTRTDSGGLFSFIGLPPGTYRVLSTFEYQTVDAAALDASGARVVKVEEGRTTAQDLDLFVLR